MCMGDAGQEQSLVLFQWELKTVWMASSDRNLHCFQKVIVNYPKIENALIIKKHTQTHIYC